MDYWFFTWRFFLNQGGGIMMLYVLRHSVVTFVYFLILQILILPKMSGIFTLPMHLGLLCLFIGLVFAMAIDLTRSDLSVAKSEIDEVRLGKRLSLLKWCYGILCVGCVVATIFIGYGIR